MKGEIVPILNYKKQFAPLVESGEKRQTIRAMRKRPFKAGDRLYHYTGLRTKACRKLLESTCLFADRIDILPHGTVFINNWLCEGPMKNLAVADGFRREGHEWEDMLAFFTQTHGLPFTGQLIRW
ncbi:hypothetical protein Dvar_36070 [Desulfosarcina variabilis str. Montpellier]